MSIAPKVFAQTTIQIIGRILVVLASLLATAILTRFFGTSGYGDYIFITAAVFLFVSLADWGTGIISVREAAKRRKKEKEIFSQALFFRFLLALFLFFFFNFLIRILPQFKSLVGPATIASFLLLSLSIRSSLQIIFQTKLRFEKLALVEISSSVLFLIFLLPVVWVWPTLSFVFVALVSSSFLACILGFFLVRSLVSFVFSYKPKILKTLFWEALPTGALLFLFSIYTRVDIFILKSLKGPEAVGIYGVSHKIYENLVLGAAYLMNALLPIISRLAKRPSKKLSLIYKKTFDVLVFFGLVVFLTIFFLAGLIVEIVAGGEFSASALVLRILVFGTFIAYLNHLTGYTLIALGKQKVSLLVAFFALLVNIFFNLLFIPQFSYLAASFSTVITEGLVFSLTSFYLAKKFGLYPSFSFLKTLKQIILTRGKIF